MWDVFISYAWEDKQIGGKEKRRPNIRLSLSKLVKCVWEAFSALRECQGDAETVAQ